ncbi:MAG: aminotransferase class V-fold PLP-dependent enzyme [Clostridiales bacterium]|nr:aminotransferase class V-fold PLP-dependent enzyme [Clostridiales bacterium]
MIYLDNGATSYPKPPEVIESFMDVMMNYCANPGRAGHFMAARTSQEIFKTRLVLARLFNIDTPGQIVFTKNCTEGLNMAFKGILREGEHVVTTSMEHNSVVRPLKALEKKDITTTIVPCSKTGELSVEAVRKAIRPNTRIIAVTAASNVTGTKMPLEEIGRLALRLGILMMVDGAQGAGHMEIDVKKHRIDILAVPGHKGLMGPQGTGLLYVREGIPVRPLLEGGTGSRSNQLDPELTFPESYEAGTVNAPGIIALGEAARVLNKIGVGAIENHERKLTEKLQEGIKDIAGVTLYGPKNYKKKTAVVAMNIDDMDCEKVASLLNDKYGIAVRAGFHCSGLAHKTMGTERTGCVRMCPGFYTSEKEINDTIKAIKDIALSEK